MRYTLSPHFDSRELVTTSSPQLQNPPDADAVLNARILATGVLEPLRQILGCPLRVTSWYRSSTLNAYVGGTPTSLHLVGAAVDVVPMGRDKLDAWSLIRGEATTVPITTAIVYEDKPHLHLSYVWWLPLEPTQHYIVTTRGKLVSWSRYRGKLRTR